MKKRIEIKAMLLGPYKEPLKKVEKGYGYMGAITLDVSGKVQCHICGDVFDNLAKHAAWKHKIKTTDYREKFGISKQTALVSEGEREKMKMKMMAIRQAMSKKELREGLKKMLEGRRRFQERMKKEGRWNNYKTLEQKNLRGICPEQLLDLISRCGKEMKKVPTMSEFENFYKTQRYFRPIKETFGTWNDALKKLGMTPHEKFGKAPPREKYRYTDEELLEALTDFHHRTGKIPTQTDSRRGYLPSQSAYIRRWGSIANARKLVKI